MFIIGTIASIYGTHTINSLRTEAFKAKQFGQYRLRQLLGKGGMGEVYKAMDARLGRVVAIKVLRADMAGDPERRERLAREARVISSLNHPHICALYDVGRHEQLDFLVMECLDGETLAARLANSRLAADETLSIARQIAEALEAAHDKAIIHRDLKPSNVMITADARVKVLDFGLARRLSGASADHTLYVWTTAPGTRLGTLLYMSPEQAAAEPVDTATDIFSLGVVLPERMSFRICPLIGR